MAGDDGSVLGVRMSETGAVSLVSCDASTGHRLATFRFLANGTRNASSMHDGPVYYSDTQEWFVAAHTGAPSWTTVYELPYPGLLGVTLAQRVDVGGRSFVFAADASLPFVNRLLQSAEIEEVEGVAMVTSDNTQNLTLVAVTNGTWYRFSPTGNPEQLMALDR